MTSRSTSRLFSRLEIRRRPDNRANHSDRDAPPGRPGTLAARRGIASPGSESRPSQRTAALGSEVSEPNRIVQAALVVFMVLTTVFLTLLALLFAAAIPFAAPY